MSDFAQYVSTFRVPDDKLGVFWLGQAGFICKFPDNRLAVIDPYLSDCCLRLVGFRRLMARLLQPYDLQFDYLLVSHAHPDHFDPDAVPMLMDNGSTQMLAALDVEPECKRLGIKDNVTYMKCGDVYQGKDFKVKAVPCDHGEDAPLAVGFLLEMNGKRLYLVGDSSFRPDYFAAAELQGCDFVALPCNGAYGNLNEREAVETLAILKPRIGVPCHYGNFAEHGGNPGIFQDEAIKAGVSFRLMRQGEGILI